MERISSGCSLLSLGVFGLPFVLIGLFALLGEISKSWITSAINRFPEKMIWPGILIIKSWYIPIIVGVLMGGFFGGVLGMALKQISRIRSPFWLRNYRNNYWMGLSNGIKRGILYGLLMGCLACSFLTRYRLDVVEFISGAFWFSFIIWFWRSELFRKGDKFVIKTFVLLLSFIIGGFICELLLSKLIS